MSLIRIAGLWKPKEKKSYALSGRAGDVVYYVFKRDKKKNENEPDFNLCIGAAAIETGEEKSEKEDGEDAPF